MKLTTIEEVQDLSNIKVDELIDSLQTFEITINEKSENKNKSISLYPTLMKMKINVRRILKKDSQML